MQELVAKQEVFECTMAEPGPIASSGSTVSGETQVDEKYNDSKADIILISKDGVLFYVESFYLKANSIVFRNMMSTAQNTRPEPIPSTNALRLFLDFIVGTEVISIPDLSVLENAMRLTEQYDCRLVKHAMLLHLHSNLGLSPWTAFCIAAAASNIPLAKPAIRQMGSEKCPPPDGRWDLDGFTDDFAKQCDTAYLLGFLRATTKNHTEHQEHTHPRQYVTKHKYDWGTAAECFEPAKASK